MLEVTMPLCQNLTDLSWRCLNILVYILLFDSSPILENKIYIYTGYIVMIVAPILNLSKILSITILIYYWFFIRNVWNKMALLKKILALHTQYLQWNANIGKMLALH